MSRHIWMHILPSIDLDIHMLVIHNEQSILFPLVPFLYHVCNIGTTTFNMTMQVLVLGRKSHCETMQ